MYNLNRCYVEIGFLMSEVTEVSGTAIVSNNCLVTHQQSLERRAQARRRRKETCLLLQESALTEAMTY